MKLKEVLARELKNQNISLRQLSQRCGIPLSVLHGWLNGARPSGKNMELLSKLAANLNVSLETLLFNSKSFNRESIILVSMNFKDGEDSYNLTIEKVGQKNAKG